MPDELIALLSDLVAIPSVNPSMVRPGAPAAGEDGVASYIVDWCAGHGLTARRREVSPGRPNVIVDLGLPHARTLLLQSHMDTVPGESMGERAYRPEVRDGRLYGRGSCDAKAQLAAMLWTMVRLKMDAARLKTNVIFIAAMDEEHAFSGALAIVADGLQAAGGIVGEPTSLQPVIAHKGVLRWDVQVHGRTAHTANPHLGVNAISGMTQVLAALESSWAHTLTEEHPLLGHGTATVVGIEGGVAPNVVPDLCRATISRRFLPSENPDDVLRACDATLDGLRAAGPDWTVQRGAPALNDFAMETEPDEPVVQATMEAIEQVTGRRPTPRGAPYSTDASKLSRLGHIPCVVLGAGDIAHAHTANEFVPLDELAQVAEIYLQAAYLFGDIH